jgi:hypothetical protein
MLFAQACAGNTGRLVQASLPADIVNKRISIAG